MAKDSVKKPKTTPKEVVPPKEETISVQLTREQVKELENVANFEPTSEESEPFEAMDRADDEQVLAEIQGKGAAIADEWIYSFRDKTGKEVTGLSWLGTKNAAYWFRRKKLGDLAITDLKIDPDPTDQAYVLFRAKCEDQINGGAIWGTKRQWTKMRLRDGKQVTDPFWYEKGTSKCQRNAMQGLMPADWIAKLIKDWSKKGKVKQIEPTTKEPTVVPDNTPPCTTCGADTIYREGVGQKGPWKGYFCSKDKNHKPQWG